MRRTLVDAGNHPHPIQISYSNFLPIATFLIINTKIFKLSQTKKLGKSEYISNRIIELSQGYKYQ